MPSTILCKRMTGAKIVANKAKTKIGQNLLRRSRRYQDIPKSFSVPCNLCGLLELRLTFYKSIAPFYRQYSLLQSTKYRRIFITLVDLHLHTVTINMLRLPTILRDKRKCAAEPIAQVSMISEAQKKARLSLKRETHQNPL